MMSDELLPCPLCGALPCDWVDNPFRAGFAGISDPAAFVEAARGMEAALADVGDVLEEALNVLSDGHFRFAGILRPYADKLAETLATFRATGAAK